jgi:hypothetical protein
MEADHVQRHVDEEGEKEAEEEGVTPAHRLSAPGPSGPGLLHVISQ